MIELGKFCFMKIYIIYINDFAAQKMADLKDTVQTIV